MGPLLHTGEPNFSISSRVLLGLRSSHVIFLLSCDRECCLGLGRPCYPPEQGNRVSHIACGVCPSRDNGWQESSHRGLPSLLAGTSASGERWFAQLQIISPVCGLQEPVIGRRQSQYALVPRPNQIDSALAKSPCPIRYSRSCQRDEFMALPPHCNASVIPLSQTPPPDRGVVGGGVYMPSFPILEGGNSGAPASIMSP